MGVNETTEETPVIETKNDYALHTGQNLPNHTFSQIGLGKFVSHGVNSIPMWRRREDAYRYAAWVVSLAEVLPWGVDAKEHTFEEALNAVRNA